MPYAAHHRAKRTFPRKYCKATLLALDPSDLLRNLVACAVRSEPVSAQNFPANQVNNRAAPVTFIQFRDILLPSPSGTERTGERSMKAHRSIFRSSIWR